MYNTLHIFDMYSVSRLLCESTVISKNKIVVVVVVVGLIVVAVITVVLAVVD